jgi:hypothetical protein
MSPVTGAAYLPANFFLPSYGIGKSLWVKASGVLSTTSTPTFGWAVFADSALGTASPANLTSGTAGVLATTGLITQATGTNMPWELEVVITCITTGTSATFLSDGTVKVYTASTSIQSLRMSSSASNPNTTNTIGTGGTTAAWYIELAAACGTSSSSNSIQCYSYICMGLN